MKCVYLKNHTRFRIGGPVQQFVVIRSKNRLVEILRDIQMYNKKFYILGHGTNVIARDTKFPGTIIKIATRKIQWNKNRVVVDAGVSLTKLVSVANHRGRMGFETLAGIPGTVGGAIYGNAGAYGREVSEFLTGVTIFDPARNTKHRLSKKQCRFSYRKSVFSAQGGSASGGKQKPWIILSAEFQLPKGDARSLVKKSHDIIRLRNKKYRQGLLCAGSIFKNILVKSPEGKKILKQIPKEKIKGGKIPAGYLLEAVSAKGMRHGGMHVPAHHGNLIVNRGRGTARDAKTLIRILKTRVHKKYGIWLEEEVRYI